LRVYPLSWTTSYLYLSEREETGYEPFDFAAPIQSRRGKSIDHRGTSLIRNCPPLGPYSRTMPRALWWS